MKKLRLTKIILVLALSFGGLGFSTPCEGGLLPTEENDAIILNMMTIGDNTVITIDDN